MANYLVTYDLNGPTPSHKQVDEALDSLGADRGRILETVWYVGYPGSLGDLAMNKRAELLRQLSEKLGLPQPKVK